MYYERCPKCEHAPLPADQALPATCPACGVVLAKVAAAAVAESNPPVDIGANHLDSTLKERLRQTLLYVPDRVESAAFWGRVVSLAGLIIWGVRLIACDYRTGELGASFMHGPLLVFHEAGHVIFSPFGEFMAVLGGTLAQLLLPAVIIAAFLWRNRDPVGAAFGGWLLGVSLLDVAPYVYDALIPRLVLLGGHTGEAGGHDWIYLLTELGLRDSAQGLGAFVHKLGAIAIVASIAWAGWLLKQQHSRLQRALA